KDSTLKYRPDAVQNGKHLFVVWEFNTGWRYGRAVRLDLKGNRVDPKDIEVAPGVKNQKTLRVAVSNDALGKNVVGPYMKKLGLTFGYLLDPRGTVKGLYRITGVPETFIIDRQGKIIRKIIGPRQWMNPEMRNLIEIALRSS
ncbi:MAG: TlpA disulfide reductase family protein, partial [Nitrospinota bacterium]|nr:TlpA disulfide reductase family protein [Nitrospinota bacterium]